LILIRAVKADLLPFVPREVNLDAAGPPAHRAGCRLMRQSFVVASHRCVL
jgi:hypothetical protein